MSAIKVFFHICAITKAYAIVDEMVQCIINSGLYQEVEGIYCYVSGDESLGSKIINLLTCSGKKFKIVKFVPNDTSYERLTLQDMHKHIQPTDKVLYVHSKGVSQHHVDEPHRFQCIEDWRRMIMYFLVGRFRECLHMLDTYETVGVNERQDHWNGNFWWVRGDYFLTLPHEIDADYYAPEVRFLFLNKPTFKPIYNSSCPQHYDHRYEPINYL